MMRLISKFRSLLADRGGQPPSVPLSDDPITYETARELASHEDPAVRRRLASRQDLRPEILYFLAGDPNVDVRREIAGNATTPPQADLRLAKDDDPDVRGSLAHKISRLAPGLTSDEQDRVRQMTYRTLELLARDQIPRVRQILAEALKDVAHAPPDVIKRLACDSELIVAGPVLQYSPVLTDEDLLEIIGNRPIPGALAAISRREPLYGAVADEVAKSEDIDAIAILLSNHSAQIREETLDRLLDRAPPHEIWHAPFVARPHLSARAVTRLAHFVAEGLLQSLVDRPELDESTRDAVFAEVRRRVDEVAPQTISEEKYEDWHDRDARGRLPGGEVALERALKLKFADNLSEQTILRAIDKNDLAMIEAALELMAGVPCSVVARIVTARSAKGVLALCWQGGLSAAVAVQLESVLAHISPVDLIYTRSDGSYPLSIEELTWQLEFFSNIQSGGTVPKKIN